jgi:hypothetical protein
MKNKIKKITAIILAGTMILGTSVTAFAAEWKQDNNGWWYQEDNGSYPTNSWKWINGKSYYFGSNGYMLSNTTTPDGYTVNADGAWVVNGAVQTQSGATSNAQYPLAGMLEQLGLNYTGVVGWRDLDGWESNLQNGSRLPSSGKYYYTNYGFSSLYAFACALSGEPYQGDVYGRTDPVAIIAEANSVSYAEGQQMVTIVRDFLNSFDWKNTDDMTKARKAAELVTNGVSYSYESKPGYISSVLLDKKAQCNDFSSTFQLLTRLMDMETLYVGNSAHQWNYVKINGQWKGFDGTVIAKSGGVFFFDIPASEPSTVTIVGLGISPADALK